MGLLEALDGVLVRTSARYLTTTSVVVIDGSRCVLVDPAVDPSDLSELAGDLSARSLDVVAAWSTHPHWDHLLWSSALGREIVPHATPDAVELVARSRREILAEIEKSSPGHELELCARLEPGAPGALGESCEVLAHSAHCRGHGALFLPERGLLVSGDMVSDVEIPLLDLDGDDPVGEYVATLERFAALAGDVRLVVPGHGHPGDGDELARRIELDLGYLDDLVSGRESADSRLAAEWLRTEHERQREWAHSTVPPTR